jgi:uncharacterized protein (TIGR02597 family)
MKICTRYPGVKGWLLVFLAGVGTHFCGWAAEAPVAASDPVGLFQIPIVPGANLISAPLHRLPSYRGRVESAGPDHVVLARDPGWAVGQFGPKDGFTQFIVMVRESGFNNPSHEGDWWPVISNSSNALTVDTRGEELTTAIKAGDHIEVRHLTSLSDLFGTGGKCILNKDSNAIPNPNVEDVIRLLTGTAFSSMIFYHDGKLIGEGYYVNGQGPFDGSTVTLWPDQPAIIFRKSGSAPAKISCRGQVQTRRLAHYLRPGPNIIGNPFAMDAPIGGSGLLEAGWISDSNGIPNPAAEDVLRPMIGSGFGNYIFHHDGTRIPAGWYAGGVLDNDFPLEPAQGYVLFIKGTDSFVWSQPPPY